MEMIPNASLKKYNTFGIDSHCAYLSHVETDQEVFEILSRASPKKTFILGGGSNILLPEFLNAWVIQPSFKETKVLEENTDSVLLRVGAGRNWHQLVLDTLKNEWGGLENLSLIPGNMGAAPIQNIGAYGVEVRQFIEQVHFIHLYERNHKVFSAEECQFGYRDSVFKNDLKGKVLITHIDLRLPKFGRYELNTSYGAIQEELERDNKYAPSPKDISNVVVRIRSQKLPDPKKIGNAGSFFKNPIISKDQLERLQSKFDRIVFYPVDEEHVKVPAGWLIDQCGWKGKREGSVGCYDQQALVIVNHNGAKSTDIKAFAQKVSDSVLDKFNITLEREVNYVEI